MVRSFTIAAPGAMSAKRFSWAPFSRVGLCNAWCVLSPHAFIDSFLVRKFGPGSAIA